MCFNLVSLSLSLSLFLLFNLHHLRANAAAARPRGDRQLDRKRDLFVIIPPKRYFEKEEEYTKTQKKKQKEQGQKGSSLSLSFSFIKLSIERFHRARSEMQKAHKMQLFEKKDEGEEIKEEEGQSAPLFLFYSNVSALSLLASLVEKKLFLSPSFSISTPSPQRIFSLFLSYRKRGRR